MDFWKRRRETEAPATVQLRDGTRNPFGLMDGYVPLGDGTSRLYRAIREGVPIVDAAIYKLIRMIGGVTAACENPQAQRELGRFLRTVPTGRGQQGIDGFLDCYLDSLLTCGRAIGEIVPTGNGREIAALLCGRTEGLELREGDNPLAFTIWGQDK